MRLLLVEDDLTLGDAVRDYLAGQGHVVDWAKRLSTARDAATEPFDAILLDWRLPDGSGIEWLRALRAREGPNRNVPVLVLTARDRLDDRVEGLDAGADDYLIKPFELAELAARVRAVSRRAHGDPRAVVEVGLIAIDLVARTVRIDGRDVELTAREYALFETLVRRRGRIVPRDQLQQLLYGFDIDVASNTIEVHVSSLRRKLGPDAIDTVRGMGYRVRA
jgi:two-component system, OmpR family, response regulator